MYLYLTADEIGARTGGGRVTLEEAAALAELASERRESFKMIGRAELLSAARDAGMTQLEEPWWYDRVAYHLFDSWINLCHLYAGTFGGCVEKLKAKGAKVSYTVAAHDREVSKREHERLGIPFNYPHLVKPELWDRYVAGYRGADVIVCPGSVPAATVRRYGGDFGEKRVEVIPHGCDFPADVVPPPQRFVCGYMGSAGADKGLRYLFAAWKKLAYTDATLILAGRDSTSPWVRQMWQAFGGGNVVFAGWQDDVSDFYNSISLYVQPSATEGFGIEVVEAMSHGRPVLCSDAAGACDVVAQTMRFKSCDVDALCHALDNARCGWQPEQDQCRRVAEQYTWTKVREKYKALWRTMLP